MLRWIVRCNVEERAAELKAMSEDEIETIIRVAAHDFLHLREANVLRVGGLESAAPAPSGHCMRAVPNRHP